MTALTLRRDVVSRNLKFNNVELNPISAYTTPKQNDLIVERYGFNDHGGDYASDRTTWVLSGYDGDNTTPIAETSTSPAKQRIYFKSTGTTDYVIQGYLDSAMTASLVISGTETTRSTGSTVTLTAENTSGLSGSVIIGDAATNDTWYVDIEIEHAMYDADVDSAAANILGFLNYNDTDASDDNWQYIESCEIVNINKLISLSCIANVSDLFQIDTLTNNLRAKGLFK